MTTTSNTETSPLPESTNKVAKTAAEAVPAKVARKRTASKPRTAPKAVPKVAASPIGKAVVEKPAKAKKPKLVRDSFTIPKTEYTVLDELKLRAGKLGTSTKKSELIRGGIKALAAMDDTTFLSALSAVPAIKTGRPAKT